jgi:hypothetical protein
LDAIHAGTTSSSLDGLNIEALEALVVLSSNLASLLLFEFGYMGRVHRFAFRSVGASNYFYEFPGWRIACGEFFYLLMSR